MPKIQYQLEFKKKKKKRPIKKLHRGKGQGLEMETLVGFRSPG